jgi:hypothetical protein
MHDATYSSKAPLTIAPAHLRREIGVSVLAIPHHAGLNGPAASIERETPTLNTVSLGSIVALDAAEATITEATGRTIADLDAAITELCAHRMRLANEYRRRAGADTDASGASPLLREFIASEARQRRLEALLDEITAVCGQSGNPLALIRRVATLARYAALEPAS